ncbi:MAG: thermonuclease family protein [Rickettsiales bacterium]|jgi:endonuclease YncB( thermonuclease family)|nr:thermonuclease family protein [Rickettsiales bacterium]
MKVFILSLTLSLFYSPTLFAVPATVGYILDGDTFAAQVLLDKDIKISVRVRLINVDAPEINGMCESEIKMAYLAKERLAELIPVGSIVELSNVKDDKYLGRIDANVKNKAGQDVGEILIKEKLGRKYSGGKRAGWCQ